MRTDAAIDISWIHRSNALTPSSAKFAENLRDSDITAETFVWVAGELEAVKDITAHIRQLNSEGIPHATEDEARLIWEDHLIWPEHYDEPVEARYWYDWFDLQGSPCAKAYRLLDNVDLSPDLNSRREGLHLAFEEGAYQGDNCRWVGAGGRLAVSLLQARLIDLNLPIRVEEGKGA
jgi:hypothetical protein